MNIDHYKQRLLKLQRELALRLGEKVETARTVTDDQADSGDVAHADELKDEYFSLAESDTAILQAVREALQRIAEGTYGKCVIDDEPIEEKRLESVPWTPYCLKHQQEIEARSGLRTPKM
jgi:DnaK suppressor protein